MKPATILGLGAAGLGAWWLSSSSSSSSAPSSSSSSTSNALTDGLFGGGAGDGGGGGASSWVKSLPEQGGPAREREILAAFNRGFTRSVSWITLLSSATIDGAARTLAIDVMDDALAVGTDTDWVRVSMSARTAQAIADSWGSTYLCTSKVADLIAQFATVRIPPVIMSADPRVGTQHMSETWVMVEYNAHVEKLRAGRAGLLSDAGKYWVASPRLGTPDRPAQATGGGGPAAANYGFFVLDSNGQYAARGPQGSHAGTGGWSHGPGGWAVWQNVGLAHNLDHADYSQTLRLVGARAVLDNAQTVDLQDIASDPKLCALVSDEGPALLRMPAIPVGARIA